MKKAKKFWKPRLRLIKSLRERIASLKADPKTSDVARVLDGLFLLAVEYPANAKATAALETFRNLIEEENE